MQRVQAALRAQLTRQNEKLEIELREKVDHLQYTLTWSYTQSEQLTAHRVMPHSLLVSSYVFLIAH